jgi:hypothetical protein
MAALSRLLNVYRRDLVCLRRARLTCIREGLAGLVHGTKRGLSDSAAVLNHVLQTFANQVALNSSEFLKRLGSRQLVQAVEIALPLLLSELEPVPGGVLKGLGQHGAATRDRFHVLLGQASKALAVLPGEAKGTCQPVRCRPRE